jgi:hypothetical protein
MKVEIITFAYNEEFLLPFFLKHYNWVDKINIVYDQDSTDNTLQIIKNNPKVNIIPFRFPDMMDDAIKIKKANDLYKEIKDCDWVLLPDVDEFIFIDKKILKKIKKPINSVKLFNVYRHLSEEDLDINMSIKEQRRHGFFDSLYNKPIIVRPNLNIEWNPGFHTIKNKKKKIESLFIRLLTINLNKHKIIGAHWSNADSCFCIDRRVKNRKERQSKANISRGYSIQNHKISEESVLLELKNHQEDPQVF